MIDTRQRMMEYREYHGLSIEEMANVCKCTPSLLEKVEVFGCITHPNIAARIANAYKLSVQEYNDLINPQHKTNYIPNVKPKPTHDDYIKFMDQWR